MEGRQAMIADLVEQRNQIAKELDHWRNVHQEATQMILRCEGGLQVVQKQITHQEKKMAELVGAGEEGEAVAPEHTEAPEESAPAK